MGARMDACEIRAPGAVLLRKSDLPAEKNYTNGHADAAVKRKGAAMPAATPATPRRHPSPNAGGRASSPTPAGSQAKRSQSTERRPATPSRTSSGGSRPTTPSRISAPASPSSAPSSPSSSSSSSSTPVRDAVSETQSAPRRLSAGRAPDGLWPSMRSLSSSFQPESKGKRISSSSSADQAKTRDAAPADRKRSPLRGRATPEQSENPHAKVIDHHRWPAMMGGRVSASTMSKSMDLTDKISRSTLPSVQSRGVSPKRTTMSSAANTLSRSIDLADKIDRLVSSSVSSQGVSQSPAYNGADDVSKKVGVRKDLKLSSLAISSRRVSPITTAASDGTRTLSESMDLTEKDNSTLSSSVSSPSISPNASLSSVSNAASQTTTKSSERLIGPVSNLSSSRGLSPRRTTSGGIAALMKSVDFPEKDRRPASSRGASPRRRLASDGVNDIVKNMDFAEKDSRVVSSSIPSRGVSPRRRLASDGVDTISRSSEFSGKDNRPSTSSSTSRGMSPRRRLASDGLSAVTKGMDFGDNANRPSTSSVASRGISQRLQLASDGVGTVSKGTDLADGLNRPSTSYATPRGMSPRRRVGSDASNATSERIKFTEKDSGTVSSSVAPRGVSTLRRLASDGVESISKSMDLVENTRPTTSSAASRGLSPRRRLSSDGVNVIPKSMDLVENNNKLVTMSAAARGVSPRRRLASDGVNVISKSIDLVENSNKPLAMSAATRGASPRRRPTSDGIEPISKSTNITEKGIRPSTSSMSSRGMSPRRRMASDGINAVLNTEFADKNCRPSSSSAALRGVSPRSRAASNAISTGMTFAEKDSRLSTASSASCQTLQSSRLEPDGVNALSKDLEISSTVSGCTSDSRLDGTGALVKSIDVTEKLIVSMEDGGDGDDPGRMDSSDIVTSAVSSSLASQEISPRPAIDDVKNASENVDATQKGNRALSVKVPSRGASPRRRLASDGIDTTSKSMDFAEKDKPMTVSVPSRGMSPRRTARSDSANIMSKSMDFADKCDGPVSSMVPSRVFSTRRVLGPDGANAMSRSMDLTDKIRQQISSTVQSSRASPRKTPLAYNRIKGPEVLSGHVESPGSADGNESQEENASSSPDAPSNNSEKITPTRQLARRTSSPSRVLIRPSSPSNASSTSSFASRRLPSPSRTRPSTPVSPCSSARSDSASSILSYIGDATRGKKSPAHMEDAHQLRLLHNRNLQWRFTNSYVDEMLSIQKINAEVNSISLPLPIKFLIVLVLNSPSVLDLCHNQLGSRGNAIIVFMYTIHLHFVVSLFIYVCSIRHFPYIEEVGKNSRLCFIDEVEENGINVLCKPKIFLCCVTSF